MHFEENIFFFVIVNMGPYRSKSFRLLLLLQIAAETFQTSAKLFLNGAHNTTFGVFEILEIEI